MKKAPDQSQMTRRLKREPFLLVEITVQMPAKAIEQPWTKVVCLDREIKYSRDTIG
jgi:hypothetical protein